MTEAETRAAAVAAPRRDFIELASVLQATIEYRGARPTRSRFVSRLFRPGFRQAWDVAGRVGRGDTVYADQELLGLSLVAAIALRRRPAKVVVLAHLPGRPWKRVAFRIASRLGVGGRLIMHSIVQAAQLRRVLSSAWEVETLPYQVDTDYWRARRDPADGIPVICAIGSEHRDYRTLASAVDGLPVRLIVAAGSNWARRTASAGTTPPNVEYLSRLLPYPELRELYEQATAVIVPLFDVPNQSGITSLLEAMSMGRPVITTATRGQREAVRGPLVRADGSLDLAATRDRGPAAILPEAAGMNLPPNGYYVPPDDVAALRAAIQRLLNDATEARALGAAGREDAERWFSIEHFARRFATAIRAGDRPVAGAGGRS